MAVGVGTLISIAQQVAKSGAGNLLTITQDVRLKLTASGTLINIAQSIQNTAIGKLLSIAQRVKDSTVASLVDKYGWDAVLTVGGVEINHGEIYDAIDIIRNENSAALMDFTLINKTGIIDFNQWHGKTVTLDVETPAGAARVYTGTVDIPEIDLVNHLITLRCTDKRKELINGQLASQLPFIGRWSSAIFNEPDDVAEELSQRLQTTTKTVDFDAYGNFTVSDFLPKSVPDFTLNDAAIYRRNPTLQVASRGRLVNRVSIDFDYRFTRLRHRERDFRLEGPTFCDVMTNQGLAFLSVNGVNSNLETFGWNVDFNSVTSENLPPAGWYYCDDPLHPFIWSPIVNTGETTNVKDSNGDIVYDAAGNPVTETRITNTTDYSNAFALSADWRASKRFAQDINQKLNIQVNAPQSQNQYGIIEKKQRNGLQIDFDTADFEKNEQYIAPENMTATATDYYQDQNGLATEFNDAVNTVIAMARTSIAKSHRDNHITIETPIWPEIDLKHTVETTAGVIKSKGKVSSVHHSLNIGTRASSTIVKLSLSQAVGAQIDNTLSIPRTTAPLVGDNYSGVLKMYTYSNASFTGGAYGTSTAHEIGMFAPAIDDESRNKQETVTDYAVDIAIRNDTLQVEF